MPLSNTLARRWRWLFPAICLAVYLGASGAPLPTPKIPQPGGPGPLQTVQSPPVITVQVPAGPQKTGATMTVGAKVATKAGVPLEGVTVSFSLDSAYPLGTAKTYPNGIATLGFKLQDDRDPGSHTIVADTPAEGSRPAGHGYATFQVADKAVSLKIVLGGSAQKGKPVQLTAAADENGSPLKTGRALFFLEDTFIGDADFVPSGKSPSLKWLVPLDIAVGPHKLTAKVVSQMSGLNPAALPARATAQATLTVEGPLLFLDAPTVTRHHHQSAFAGGTLYLSKDAMTPAANQEIVLTWDGIGENCTTKTDVKGKFSCGGIILKASVRLQSYSLSARLKSGEKIVANGSLVVEKDPPGEIKASFVAPIFKSLFQGSILVLNSLGPRHGDSWHQASSSSFRIGGPSNPTTIFDIPELGFGPVKYYLNNITLRSLDGTIENGKFKLVAAFNDSNPEIKGRCAGSAVCLPGSDSTAPDAQMDDIVITILLTPAAWNGTIAFSDVSVTYSGNPSINGACHIPGLGDVCEAFGHYKERIKKAIEAGLKPQVDSDTVRGLFGVPFANIVKANSRGPVTKAWMDASGNIFYEAPIVDQ